MLNITEKILIHQIKNRNEQAFARFYDTYRVQIYRFLYFKVSTEDVAQDLVNDTFIRIFNYLKNGQEIDNLRALLYKTARNLTIDFYRSRGRGEMPIDEFIEETVSTEQDIEKHVDIKIELENIAESVKKLPEPYKEVILLRFIDGLSFEEISQAIDKSPENCRMIAHRGLRKIKLMLQK